MILIPASTPEALAIRQCRIKLHATKDPLAERARTVALWRTDPWPHFGPPCRPLYRHPGFTRYLMPSVRAHLAAKEAARRARLAAESADYERRCAERKAARLAAKAPQMVLL